MTHQEKLSKIKLGLLPKECVPKPKKFLKKVSDKKRKEMAGSDDDSQDRWYVERRKEMTGRCIFCGGKTEKDNDETYRRSIAHLFAKRKNMFPSVATHPLNFLELCFWSESCHTNFDNGIITLELLRDSKEWSLILSKAKAIIPFMTAQEYNRVPQIILNDLI